MKILIADKLETAAVSALKQFAEQVVVEPELNPESFAAKVRELDPQILIVRSRKVTRPIMEAGRGLKLIVRAGSGVDNIDVPAASERGISVANCPGANAVAVAELAMGLILSLDRHIPDNVADFRAGKWNKKLYSKGVGLKGLTLGVVGAGKIGSEVARRALAFEMKVLYFHLGRNVRLTDFPQASRAELDDLMRESDVITLHIPGGHGTEHMIDEDMLSLMKPGALLINTSRPTVVDEAALIRAVRSGRIRGAGLDVFEGEPLPEAVAVKSPLQDVPNVYVTHHIGASTAQAQAAVAEEVVRIVAEYKNSHRVLNCVNVAGSGATCMLVVRLVNRPGSLARVFQDLAKENVNIEEMEHVIYDGGKAACAHVRVNRLPSEDTLAHIRGSSDYVLGLDVLMGG